MWRWGTGHESSAATSAVGADLTSIGDGETSRATGAHRLERDVPLAGTRSKACSPARRRVPPATVHACTWYFRLLLKWAIVGVIVGMRSLSERLNSPDG